MNDTDLIIVAFISNPSCLHEYKCAKERNLSLTGSSFTKQNIFSSGNTRRYQCIRPFVLQQDYGCFFICYMLVNFHSKNSS